MVEIHTQHGHTAISEASQIGVLSAGGGGSLGGGGEIIEPCCGMQQTRRQMGVWCRSIL